MERKKELYWATNRLHILEEILGMRFLIRLEMRSFKTLIQTSFRIEIFFYGCICSSGRLRGRATHVAAQSLARELYMNLLQLKKKWI
jgi:hypothetical protein